MVDPTGHAHDDADGRSVVDAWTLPSIPGEHRSHPGAERRLNATLGWQRSARTHFPDGVNFQLIAASARGGTAADVARAQLAGEILDDLRRLDLQLHELRTRFQLLDASQGRGSITWKGWPTRPH
jgi:hypothetical protein